jgi:DNA-binding XRE family transcriptional regulator
MRKLARDYERALDALVDEIYEKALEDYDWTWGDLAAHAGLSYSTIVKLGERTTRLPQLRTIYHLAKAVGMDVAVVKHRLRVRKVA